ncbi:MAG TPA: histidine phosphatase family protein [Acidimicrobiia bacterium]|nr:histidine phosphatase family protein [Acidimicrobiia bacterium]
MPVHITFVRHAETDANASGIWQGHGGHGLSARGRLQAEALGRRLAGQEFDFVVSSDLPRAIDTAEAAGLDPKPDPAWREIDIGVWEGLTRDEVHARFPDEITAVRAGEPVKMGGGESWHDLGRRVNDSFEVLVDEAPADSRILVMTHGGVVHAVIAGQMRFRDRSAPWPIDRVRNTGITEVSVEDGAFRLGSFNDQTHFVDDDTNGIALIRHAESEANAAGRWHGVTDGPLTTQGRRQAENLGRRYAGVTRVYSSPLERARATAEAFAGVHGLSVGLLGDLIEVDFGAWEGLTPHEIAEQHPEDWARVFESGEDIPRGGTGDTFEAVGQRMAAVIERMNAHHPGERVALFSHGGAIWSLTARVLGLTWSEWRNLAMPGNTSVSHVRMESGRQMLVDYNI